MRGSAAFRVAVAPGGALAGPWVQNSLWTAARAVPSLDLRFADNKSLTDAVTGASLVTFTRASTGTYVGSDGLLQSAVTNLLTYSEQFDNASWTKNNVQAFGSGSVANATIAPNGTLTADKIVENTATAQHMVYQNTTPEIGKAYVLTFYAKAAERIFVTAAFSGGGLPSDCRFGVNLSTGEIVSGSTSGSPELTQVTPIGDGWYRIALIKTIPAASGLQPRILMSTNGTTQSYLGDGTSGLYLWGAQLEQSATVGEYIPTTSVINSAPRFDHNPTTGESLGLLVEEARTNLVLRSEEFDNASWTKTRSSVTADAITAPNGTTTADTLIEDSSASATHFISQGVSITSGTNYAFSVFIKRASGSRNANLRWSGGVATGNMTVDLTTGAVTASAALQNPSATAFSNGWWRVTFWQAATSTGTFGPQIFLHDGTTITYTGDGTSGIYIWGAQLEAGAFPTSYIPTTSATVTRAADVASITGTAFSSFYNQTEGTVFANYAERAFSVTHQVATVSNGTANERISLAINTSNTLDVGVISGGADTFGGNTPTLTAQEYRIGFGYKADNSGVSANGSAITVDSAVTLPTVSQLDVGARAGSNQMLNSTIKRFTYWPARFADNTLQAITQ